MKGGKTKKKTDGRHCGARQRRKLRFRRLWLDSRTPPESRRLRAVGGEGRGRAGGKAAGVLRGPGPGPGRGGGG
jgi:hypothetical protein